MRREQSEDADDDEFPEGREMVPVQGHSPTELSAGLDDGFMQRLGEYVWSGPNGQIWSANQVRVFLGEIVVGVGPKLALRCAGIDRATVRYWLKSGRDKGSKFHDFYLFYKSAKARAEANFLKDIFSAGRMQWQAAYKALELIRPDKYGKKVDESDKEPCRVVVLPPGEEP